MNMHVDRIAACRRHNTCLHERVWQAINSVGSLTVADSSSRTGCLQPVALGMSMASQTCKGWLDPPADRPVASSPWMYVVIAAVAKTRQKRELRKGRMETNVLAHRPRADRWSLRGKPRQSLHAGRVMTARQVVSKATEPLTPCGVVYLLPIRDELDEAVDPRHGWKVVAHLSRFFRCQARRDLHGCQHRSQPQQN